jgi:hypothetical protein
MSKWFPANKLALNIDKTNVIKFMTHSSSQHASNIGCGEKDIEEKVNTKFLGLQIDELNWKSYIVQIIPKLSRACSAVRLMVHVNNTATVKSIYFAFFSFHNEMWNNFGG